MKNPFEGVTGKCFDATAFSAVDARKLRPTICHGIGWSKDGNTAHAWLEIKGRAYDSVARIQMPAHEYRKRCRLRYVKEYSFDDFMEYWRVNNNPGPWDPEIYKFTKEGKEKK